MNRAHRNIIRKPSSKVFAFIWSLAILLAVAFGAYAQTPGTPPTTPPPTPPPVRIDAGGGKYVKVYFNTSGHIIREDTFEMGGGLLQPEVLIERRDYRVNLNGIPSEVVVSRFEDIPNTLGGRKLGSQEVITYNNTGEPREKIQKPLDCNGVPSTTVRIITTWAAGTREPTVRVQQRDASGSWIDLPGQPKPPEKTGPGPISSNTNPALPNGTTATGQTRVRANGDNSLLISLDSPRTAVESLMIELPKVGNFSVGSLPQNWTIKMQDGKKLLVGGSGAHTINIRLDTPRGGDTPAGTRIEIEARIGQRSFFKTDLTTTPLPPVTKVDDLASALNLPPEITPGQPFLATPKPGFTAGTWRIANGPAGQWINTGDPTYRPLVFKVAENESPRPKDRVFFRYQYYDQYNELLRDAPSTAVSPVERTKSNETMTVDRFAFAGQSTSARGNSPNWEDWIGLYTLDGTTPLRPLAASPTTIIFSIPATVTPGRHVIQRACPTDGQITINILGVEGSIDTSTLWRGESTTMRLRVIGTDESLPIEITNNTPSIIDLEGGLRQTVSSSGGASNIVNRQVKGIMRGPFQIDYRLDKPPCGGGAGLPETKTP